MGRIKDKLLKLTQGINSVRTSIPINYIKLDFIEKMEGERDNNSVFDECLTKIEKYVDKANSKIDDYESLMEMKNTYSEAYIFSKLKSLLVIEKIKESDKKTPDYKVKFRERDIYLELKSLNMFLGIEKQKSVMYDSMNSKIYAEEQIKK